MKASIILAHPYPKSFNHAIFKTVIEVFQANGVTTFSHDLHDEGFNPVITTRELGSDKSTDPLVNLYADELLKSDCLVFIHPNWWGQPPALMKGYIDRVIRPPHAYDFPEDDTGGGLPIQKLTGRQGVVFNTSNTAAERENTYFGDPLEKIWKYCVFGFLGIEKYHRRMFRIIAESTEQERKGWLRMVEEDVAEILGSGGCCMKLNRGEIS